MDTNLDQVFVETVLSGVETKNNLTKINYKKYLMRAAMAGIIVLLGYVMYFEILTSFGTYSGADTAAWGKFLAASLFPLCLVSIYYTKSELLTSNMMMTTIGVDFGNIGKKTAAKILGLCYAGNLLGGILFGLIIALTSITSGDALETANHVVATKYAYVGADSTILSHIDLIGRAILCNFCINLAMLMVYNGNVKSDFGKFLAFYFGVFLFCYLGLEHSVANTVLFAYMGWVDLFTSADVVFNLWYSIQNVFFVLIGNFIGGGLLIGLYYSRLNKN